MQYLQWDRSSAAQSAAMACAAQDVRFAAGPAAYASGGRVRFFQLEPTLPAYHGHHTHAAGHFHQPHRPVRTAHVGRATGCFTVALEARGYYLRVIGRQKRRVKRRVLVLMDILRSSMLRDQAFMCVCGVCVPHPPHLCHPWHGETLP